MQEFEKFITHLKFEALALAVLMVVLTGRSAAPLWVLPASFIFFDIGMIGYLINSRTGAITYNVMHDLTVPTLLIAFGLLLDIEPTSVAGFCWTFHIAVDRALGFGLKQKKSFHHTHLGVIKKTN